MIRFQCSTFVEIEELFPLQETMYYYNKSVLSPYDPTKLAIHSKLRSEDDLISNCGPNVKKTVSFDDVVAALMSLNHTIDTYSVFNQYPQLTTQQPRTAHIRCSLHCERWTVKGKYCASALHSFKETIYWTDD